MLSFLPVLFRQIREIENALSLRGLDKKKHPLLYIKTVSGVLLRKVILRSRDISHALQVRGLNPELQYHRLSGINPKDTAVFTGSMLYFVMLFLLG